MVRRIWLAGVTISLATVALAQKGTPTSGGGTTTGGGGATTGSTSNRTPTNTPNSTSNSNTTPNQPRPIFVSGRVMIDGADAPPERVSIERVCAGGTTIREGYTDSKGYFSFQLGANAGVFADASLEAPMSFGNGAPMNGQSGGLSGGSNSMGTDMWSCELRASLTGFHSESISLATRRSMDNPDVGIIMLTRMVKVDGLTTSATIALAPKDVKKSYEKGLNFAKKSKPDEAQAEFQHVVEVYPRHAGAWFELGKVYEARNHTEEARDAYNKAIKSDANYVNPYERLYQMDMREGKWKDAADLSEKVMRLNPYEFPSAYFFNALANVQLQNWDAAEKSAREAAKIHGTRAMPKSLFLLGLVQANKGDLPGSVETLHGFLKTEPEQADKERAQKLLGQVEQNLAAKNQSAPTPRQ